MMLNQYLVMEFNGNLQHISENIKLKKKYQPNQIQDRKTKQSRLRDDSDKARSHVQ